MGAIDELAELFAGASLQQYLGEPVTLAQHMLQAAALAEAAGAPDAVIVAALLHDIGHIVPDGVRPHETTAACWLTGRFPAETCVPVRLHVDAKRYLCAVDSSYFNELSEASRQ